MTRNSHQRFIRNIVRNHSPFVEPPSAELEQKALLEFGEQDGPAVQAIFQARRHERWLTFSVEPTIAAFHGLSQREMTRAMDRLEGRLIETVFMERGNPREIRLLDDWENPEALASDLTRYRRALAEAIAAKEAKERSDMIHLLPPHLTLPREFITKLRSLLDPPKDS